MTMDGDDLRLDGNAAAGLLGELFRFDLTVAVGCGGYFARPLRLGGSAVLVV